MTEHEFIVFCRSVVKRCHEDLEKDTIQTRDSFDQIRGFHFDSIEKMINKVEEAQ